MQDVSARISPASRRHQLSAPTGCGTHNATYALDDESAITPESILISSNFRKKFLLPASSDQSPMWPVAVLLHSGLTISSLYLAEYDMVQILADSDDATGELLGPVQL